MVEQKSKIKIKIKSKMTKKHDLQQDRKKTEEKDSVVAGENKEESARLEEKVAELENKYKRALADYQNLEKRTQETRREWIQSANKELVLRFLPVLDTLMLAQAHGRDQGITLSVQQFLSILKQEGVEQIQTLGKKFNPAFMECIQTVEGEEEMVIEEVRAGYTMFEKVLRPAQVNVGKGTN